MAFVAISRDNQELIFDKKPEYDREEDCWRTTEGDILVYEDYADFSAGTKWEENFFYGIDLPKGSIRKLIGRELTWEDEPVELKEE